MVAVAATNTGPLAATPQPGQNRLLSGSSCMHDRHCAIHFRILGNRHFVGHRNWEGQVPRTPRPLFS